MTIIVSQPSPSTGRTLLQIIQTVCGRVGLTQPNAVISSTDLSIIQLLALANEEGISLATGNSVGLAYDWAALQTEASFTTVADNLQGAITTLAPGFRFILNDTIWNRSTKLPAYGGVSPQEWQTMKAWGVINPYPQYRLQGGNLLLMPAPAAGQSFYFEYQSANWCQNAAGSITRSAWAADDDTAIINDNLIIDGIVWRWKSAKGLEYAENFRSYQANVLLAMGRDGGKTALHMGGQPGYQGGVVVPIGNWGQ